MFVIDQCLVLPVNGSGLDFNDGERIVWPAGRAFELGVTVEPTQMGVLMKGRQTASQYASLLHGFSYWPPIEIEKRVNDQGLASGLLLERKFQLICSYNDAGILLSSPIIAKETTLNKNVVYSDNSRSNPLLGAVRQSDEDEDDDEDDDDEFSEVDDPFTGGDTSGVGYVQWPPYVMTYGEDPSLRGWEGGAQFAHSDKEVRPVGALGLHEKDQLKKAEGGKINTFGLAIGSGVACFAVMAMVIAFFISKSNGFRRGKLRFFRRGGSKAPGHFQYRPEARLNVIENPIEQMEGGKLSWQPPITTPTPILSEGIPGVHVPYGARDDQFDAETRSFNGLFEEDDGDADEGIAAAVLEEVDDFDESELSQHMERIPGDTPRHHQDIEADGDGIEDDEDTSFSVGPNHLDFVTLPGPRHGRGFNPDI
ncbi:unnamed protein product [Rodentolepis nana]|uniref:LAM_G_DOMAIN domain-containing protein n=1 Tax=Rodentolepis nana TaxID=102285 RepID=A0A0R3TTV8_RODNA|nr:unnamed protein product [Rodentolepis nana]